MEKINEITARIRELREVCDYTQEKLAEELNIPAQQYAEYEDIMDLDVPLAAPNIPGVGTVSVPNAPQVIEPNQHGRIPNWMLIAGAVLLVGLISVLYWYLLFYRKKKKYASFNEDYDILDFDKDDDF